LAEKISTAGVAAVLVIDDAKDAVPLARALLDGGVGVMELTLRTPAALDALKLSRREVPALVAGIGTILTVEQLREAQAAGAAFGVSPGCNPRLLSAARDVIKESDRAKITPLAGEASVLVKNQRAN
jgi:2-dehydro-3-deoxyphosphogluconate aldolase/(4S)-4-hydroxy-2-oxoglutarate aldolase